MSTSDVAPEPEDERPVEEPARQDLPDRLDPPLEADEADVLEQAIEVPPDDDDH
jgi:hypothetical protein